MADKTYKCTKTNCDNGLLGTSFAIEAGSDEVCPECGEKAVPVIIKKPVRLEALAASGAVVAVIAVVAFAFWPTGPSPEQAQAMLTEFFPGLPK